MGNSLPSDELVKRWGGQKEMYEVAQSHYVALTRFYYLCSFPVRVRDFAKFVEATRYKTVAEIKGTANLFGKDGVWRDVQGASWRSPGFPQTMDHPVVCVSWFDAQKYIEWLNEYRPIDLQLNLPVSFQYALPTEAEWEYACRAGTTTEFFWGTNDEDDGLGYLNAADKTGAPNGMFWNEFFPFQSGYKATSPVCCFKPNAWGLYDMLGNVWEWCADGGAAYPTKPVVDPFGRNSTRAIRGGCWSYGPSCCRSAARSACFPTARFSRLGFRVAVKLVENNQPTTYSTFNSKKSFVRPTVEFYGRGAGATLRLKINGVDCVFRECPAGTFKMGSPASEEGRFEDEELRNVTISQMFWILDTPVTQALWKAIAGYNPSFFKGDALPVERVSWDQCDNLIKQMNLRDLAPDGFVFDLPTEAEWEYACRAGSSSPYYSGDELTSKIANFSEITSRTTPVRTYPPNAWGLYDMLGNVGEWCSDLYGAYSESGSRDPKGARTGSKRVFRGGAWCYGASYCRAACRKFDAPTFTANRIGFRLVLRETGEKTSRDLSAKNVASTLETAHTNHSQQYNHASAKEINEWVARSVRYLTYKYDNSKKTNKNSRGSDSSAYGTPNAETYNATPSKNISKPKISMGCLVDILAGGLIVLIILAICIFGVLKTILGIVILAIILAAAGSE